MGKSMKTSANSQSGYISLVLLFVCVIIFLFAMGGQGIYTAFKNRRPVVMSCEEFARTRPRTVWLALTNCTIDLTTAAYQTLRYRNVEMPSGLFIPVRSASEKEPVKDTVLLATRDPELMKTLHEMESQPSQEAVKEWVARNVDRVFQRRDVKGLVQFGVELDSRQRSKLARLQKDLAPDFIILDDGKKPEVTQSFGYLALGGVFLIISVVMVKRSREPNAAEAY
jgi:hypothetical protein